MKTSKASSYAMHALMYMVRHSTMLPVNGRVIARSERISEGYLAKIFQRLVRANIVAASKARGGGYLFARPPEQISVLEVVEVIEGKPLFDECFMKHCDCGGTVQSCDIYRSWREATEGLKESLAQMSLAEATWAHPAHYFEALWTDEQGGAIERNSHGEETRTGMS